MAMAMAAPDPRHPRRRRRHHPGIVALRDADDSDVEVDDDDSEEETEEEGGGGGGHRGGRRGRREDQNIHSGQFMVSAPHAEQPPPRKGYDFDTVDTQTCRTYRFGKTSASHISIDASLTKLFECMTLAYSGKLVSPKWKNFKGLKLLWRDKIRLNNAIWRAWYLQYVEKRENPVCHFVTPLDGNIDSEVHRPAEAIATEGKYWKRRIGIVIKEYHKWRTYFKKRLQKHKDDDLSSLLQGPEEQLSLFGEVFPDTLRVSLCQDEEASRRVARKSHDSPVPMEMDQLFDMDVLMSEFSDTLFSTLASHQPVVGPSQRDVAHAVNADMIQPGLITLQPNLDFMDSFEPLQDLFHSLRQPFYPAASPPAPPLSPPPISSGAQAQLMPSMQLSAEDLSALPPGPLAPPTITGGVDAYVHDYMPLFAQPSVSQPLAHGPLAHCLPDGLGPLTVITRTTTTSSTTSSTTTSSTTSSSSSARASDTASAYIQGLEYGCVATLEAPPTPVSQLLPLAPCPANQLQTFALPRPILATGIGKAKGRHVQRIVPASNLPASHLILAGPFSTAPNTMIVTPAPLKAEVVVPGAGMVVTSSNLGGAPGFHIVPQTHKSPQPIVPKEESYSASCKGHKSSRNARQGSPDNAQSPLAGAELSKNDPNQSRRVPHISAEQKRRFNINIGFKTLGGLVPTLKAQSNITNATTLQRTVEHLAKLQQDRQQMQEEARRLREEIEELNGSIRRCQEQLPGTGVSMTTSRFNHAREFEAYVKSRTLQDWKFWIFSIIIKPLFESFNNTVSTACEAELYQTTLQWLDRHCTLPVLRAMVCSTLRQLGTSTSILTEPSLLPKEVFQAIGSSQRPCGDS